MKVTMEFECDNAAFEDGCLLEEMGRMFEQAYRKCEIQLGRRDVLCSHPEWCDKIIDSNGNTVGRVEVTNCGGTYYNGPDKRYVRCNRCHRIDWEANEGDRCKR